MKKKMQAGGIAGNGMMPMTSMPQMAKKGAKVNKSKNGTSLKPVDKASKPGLAKLPTAVRNKMGYQKTGGATKKVGMHKMPDGSMMKNSKMKSGGLVKSKTAQKKMMGGGKCRSGC